MILSRVLMLPTFNHLPGQHREQIKRLIKASP